MTRARRRIGPISSLDEQAMRSALDRALQLISQDLLEVCEEFFPEAGVDEWVVEAQPYTRPLNRRDPVFWVQQFKRPDAPVHQAIGRPAGQLNRDFEKVRRLRNALYHFGETYDPARTRGSLYELLRVARACGLRAADDIETALADLAHHQSGEAAAPPSLSDALRAADSEHQAAVDVERHDREREQLAEALARTQDALDMEKAARGTDAQRISELQDEARRLARLQQESEIRATHLEELHRASLAALPVARPDLSRATEDYLTSVLWVVGAFEQFLAARGPSPSAKVEPALAGLRDRIEAILPASQLSLTEHRDPSDLNEAVLAVVTDYQRVSKAAMEDLRSRETRISDEARARGLSEDEQLPDDLLVLERALTDSVDVMEQLHPELGEIISAVISVLESESVPRNPPRAAAPPVPGQRWTWPRGDEVWVLSAAHRRMKRHSERVGFVELYGPAQERQVVEAWLAIRPEGGRVYIDADGDACTFGAHSDYVYLGRLDRA